MLPLLYFLKTAIFGQLKHTQDSNEYEVNEATGRKEIDVVVDAVGSDEIIPIGFDMIVIGGAYDLYIHGLEGCP